MTVSYLATQKVHDGGEDPLTVQDFCESICEGLGRIIFQPVHHKSPIGSKLVMSEIAGVEAITISFYLDSCNNPLL